MNEKSSFWMILIVAIVAVIGILVMISSNNAKTNFGSTSENYVGQAAKSAAVKSLLYCTDSDNGLNYYTFGTVESSDGKREFSNSDFCINSSKITEYYCQRNTVKSAIYTCPYECSLGKCINVTAACGNGFVEPGEECDDGNNFNNDQCNNNCMLTFCGDAIIQNPNGQGTYEECDDGNTNNNDTCRNNCTINVIQPTCTDTDGGLSLYVKGTVYGIISYWNQTFNYSYTDSCIGTTKLLEYWCANNSPTNFTFNCTCMNGTCVNATGSIYVFSNPSIANVYVDNIYRGTTPITVSGLSIASHTVKVSKIGYYDYITTVMTDPFQTVWVNVTLNQTLNQTPISADLYAEDIVLLSVYGNVSLNNTLSQGIPFRIHPKVKNTGNTTIYPYTFYNRITFGSPSGTNSTYVRCTNSGSALAPGSSIICQSDNIIRNLTVGSYPISIAVDYNNTINESNEANNARSEAIIIY